MARKGEKNSPHQYCNIGRIINKAETGQNDCESGGKFLIQDKGKTGCRAVGMLLNSAWEHHLVLWAHRMI